MRGLERPGLRELLTPAPRASQAALVVKNLPALPMQEMQATCIQSLGWEDPLEEGTATHSSILDWRIPWTEQTGGLQSMGCTESDTTEHYTKPNCPWMERAALSKIIIPPRGKPNPMTGEGDGGEGQKASTCGISAEPSQLQKAP